MTEQPQVHLVGAKRYFRVLLFSGAACLLLGLFLASPLWSSYAERFQYRYPDWSGLGGVGASLLVAASGLLSSAVLAWARGRLLKQDVPRAKKPLPRIFDGRKIPSWVHRGAGLLERYWPAKPGRAVFFCQTIAAAVPAGLAAKLANAARSDAIGWDPAPQLVVGIALVLAAFPILVVERHYAAIDSELLPEAPRLKALLRVPLVTFLGIGISRVLLSLEMTWATWIERGLEILILVVGAEIVIRCLAALFLPLPAPGDMRSLGQSTVAGLLRLGRPSLSGMAGTVEKRFGIDLSRSWALGFMRRAALPIVAGLGVFAWLLTGVTSLGLSERAIYERGGVPVEVLEPGLHVRLPWPFGVMRRIEFGTIHEIPIFFSSPASPDIGAVGEEDEEAPSASAPAVPGQGPTRKASAEAPPPRSADRLWDSSHQGEGGYLIASEANGQQTFQMIVIDLRLIYRIGLSADAARAATYNVVDPETHIRAHAGQLLARYFASHTLPAVLGEDQATLSRELQSALQRELDALSTGVDIVAVVVEAIHPPAGAASAYHAVQAAEIRANSSVSGERAGAVRTQNDAATQAIEARNTSAAASSEAIAAAEGAARLFDAERLSYRRGGQSFLLERRFERLGRRLGDVKTVIVDHRLTGADAPTIDLRSFSAPASYGDRD